MNPIKSVGRHDTRDDDAKFETNTTKRRLVVLRTQATVTDTDFIDSATILKLLTLLKGFCFGLSFQLLF